MSFEATITDRILIVIMLICVCEIYKGFKYA